MITFFIIIPRARSLVQFTEQSDYGSLSSLDSQNSEENKNKTVQGHFENRRGV